MSRPRILAEISVEATRSTLQHGDQTHLPNGTGGTQAAALAAQAKADTDAAAAAGTVTWAHILDEEVREALAEAGDVELRAELVQVASTATKWIEAIDKRNGQPPGGPSPLTYHPGPAPHPWRSATTWGDLFADQAGAPVFVGAVNDPELAAAPVEPEDPAAPLAPWRLAPHEVVEYCRQHPGITVALLGTRLATRALLDTLAAELGDEAPTRYKANGREAVVMPNGSRIEPWPRSTNGRRSTLDAVVLAGLYRAAGLPTAQQLAEILPLLQAAVPVSRASGLGSVHG